MPSFVDEWDQLPPFPWVHETSVKIRCRPHLPRTRRRFVKLLMSKGVERNDANILANLVRWQRGQFSYAELTWKLLVAPFSYLAHLERQVLFGDGQQPAGMVPDEDTEGEGGEQ